VRSLTSFPRKIILRKLLPLVIPSAKRHLAPCFRLNSPSVFVYTRACHAPLQFEPNSFIRPMPMLSQFYSSLDPKALLAQPGVLAVVAFDSECAPASTPGIIPVGLTSLSGQPLEVIGYGDEPARRGRDNDCDWRVIGDVMCVATWISAEACADIESATDAAYRRLFSVIDAAGFNHPFRIWNFMPHINRGSGDEEEYKKFCVGRQHAFASRQLDQQQFPAASALGHQGEGAVIYMLAHNQPSLHIENKRQQPAYEYPRQYGPCSPSFARATLLPLQNRDHLFISGTASILGHDTKAAGDLQQQLAITLENIQHLIEHSGIQQKTLGIIRVYLRHAEDYSAARQFLLGHFPAEKINFIHADICRDNLLVEIEAACSAELRL
jgi:chorismate lyase/3-hydroxybenzoate synthase